MATQSLVLCLEDMREPVSEKSCSRLGLCSVHSITSMEVLCVSHVR